MTVAARNAALPSAATLSRWLDLVLALDGALSGLTEATVVRPALGDALRAKKIAEELWRDVKAAHVAALEVP